MRFLRPKQMNTDLTEIHIWIKLKSIGGKEIGTEDVTHFDPDQALDI